MKPNFKKNINYKLSHIVEEEYEWFAWLDLIPYIKWPASWEVRAIPPFSGAIIRYNIKKPNHDDVISVYLDGYSQIGIYGDYEPYWEVYPHKENVFRCSIHDTKALIKAIKEAGTRKKKSKFIKKLKEIE